MGIAKQYADSPDPPASLEFLLLVDALMTEHNLQFPQNVGEALDLYIDLINYLEDLVQ